MLACHYNGPNTYVWTSVQNNFHLACNSNTRHSKYKTSEMLLTRNDIFKSIQNTQNIHNSLEMLLCKLANARQIDSSCIRDWVSYINIWH